MAKSSLIWFIACAVIICICQAKTADLGRLKIKLNKLYREHDALQREVDDVWATIIKSGIDVQDYGNKTRTDDLSTDAQELISKMNGTLSSVKDLKTEVDHLILTSRNGIKNEKQWQRGTIRNITGIFEDFQLEMTEKYKEVKHHLERLDTETASTDQACNDMQVALETKTLELDSRIGESGREQGVANERIMKILENLTLKDDKLEMDNQELKRTISDMQKVNQQKLSNIETENQELKRTISDMQKDNLQKLSNIETENQEFKSEIGAGQKDNQKLQSHVEAENQAFKETISELKTVIERHHPCFDWENFNDHCYLAVLERKTWDDASAFCESNNSYLVEITTDAELDFAADLLRKHSSFFLFWIGATDKENNGTFVYNHSKQEVPEKYWGNGQPNQNGDEPCVASLQYYVKTDVTFHDYRCNTGFSFICEKP